MPTAYYSENIEENILVDFPEVQIFLGNGFQEAALLRLLDKNTKA